MNQYEKLWAERLEEVKQKGTFKTNSGSFFSEKYSQQEREDYCIKMIERNRRNPRG